VGCALSHFYVILQFLRSEDSYCTIFEDDIDFLPHATAQLIEQLVTRIPTCDMIFLCYHTTTLYNVPDHGSIGFTPFHPGKYLGGTFAYVLTRAGAQKIYEEIVLRGITEAIDGFYRQLLKDEILSAYEIGPRIVTSQWVDSKTSEVDSDIQRDRMVLPI
jgi:GR25 family glycosyltransferase involved in LPS biosynthesis